ncbi:MAG: hypothetical protein ACJATQ_000619 [Cellvibrionaceae bacterium]|jgi:hypothetical protein
MIYKHALSGNILVGRDQTGFSLSIGVVSLHRGGMTGAKVSKHLLAMLMHNSSCYLD